MKKFYLQFVFASFFLCGTTIMVFSQNYIMSNSTVSTCSGNFYDTGGSSGNYGNNENLTMTFCSSNNQRIEIDFSSISIANGDFLYVYYGSTATGTPAYTYTNVNGINPPKITSTCNCITFRFTSNASGVRAGWAGVLSCTSISLFANDLIFNAPAPPLNGTCLTGQTNIGATADYAVDCFVGERTVWYDVSLDPDNNTLTVTMQNATFPDGQVQYLLVFGNCPNFYYYPSYSAQCGPATNTYQWTDLREGQYYLGVNTTAANVGNFDICITQSWIDVCGDFYCGNTESCSTCPFDCNACPENIGGPYFHPVSGIQNTYLGICMVNTSSGSYYDNGGPGATYANNINQIYRTFCPSQANTAMRATVNLLQLEYPGGSGCYDVLSVLNGPTQNSSVIWSGCGNTALPVIRTLNGAYGGGVFTSTHPSGCLSFRFTSDVSNIGYWEGWDITLSTVPFSGNPDTYNNDCENAVLICSDATITSQVYGPGQVSDGCGSCVTSEFFTEWYRFVIKTGGTVEMSINPVGNSDMDFAIYKSDNCGNLGMPIRCSFAAYSPPGKTGMKKGEGDISEDVTGNQWVSEMIVNAGEVYYMMISEWDKRNPNQYSIYWTLSDGASFECSPLPIELRNFKANCDDSKTTIFWETASELNNDYFTLERSFTGLSFEPVAIIPGAGTTNELTRYFYEDAPFETTVYYRLIQKDFDGKQTTSHTISVTCNQNRNFSLVIGNNSDSGFLDILHDSQENIKYTLSLFDILGNVVWAEEYIATNELTNKKINTSSLQSGIYLIHISSELNNHSKKIFIHN